jgi:hypothetical protein
MTLAWVNELWQKLLRLFFRQSAIQTYMALRNHGSNCASFHEVLLATIVHKTAATEFNAVRASRDSAISTTLTLVG